MSRINTLNDSGSRMQLLLVSTTYPENQLDWRGTFIFNLVQALAGTPGLDVKLWAPPGKTPDDVCVVSTAKEQRWLKRLMDDGGIAKIYKTRGFSGGARVVQLLNNLRQLYGREVPQVDIVHVNWLQNSLPLFNTRVPMLVTVLGSDMKLLKLPTMVFLLRSVFKKRHCIIAPNADWMVKDLSRYFSDVATVRTISFGIDQEWYELYKGRKRVLWQKSRYKWIVVLRITEEKIGMLFRWGEEIFAGGEHELHLFGPMQGEVKIPDWINYHGATNPDELQKRWFPIATGLISLSQHDEGRPQVMLEAMAAGVPIIASDIPAHKDLISHDETGLICENEDQFRHCVAYLAESEFNEKISRKAHFWASDTVGTWDDCAARYSRAYAELEGLVS